MQPVLTQVPPNDLRSMIATLRPAATRRPANEGPAWPVPMMIASYLVIGFPSIAINKGRDETMPRPFREYRAQSDLPGSVKAVSQKLEADRQIGILTHIITLAENRPRGLDTGVGVARRIAVDGAWLRSRIGRRDCKSRGGQRAHEETGKRETTRRQSLFDTIEHVIISTFVRRIGDCPPRWEEHARRRSIKKISSSFEIDSPTLYEGNRFIAVNYRLGRQTAFPIAIHGEQSSCSKALCPWG